MTRKTLLNSAEISTQLRDWQQIAQAKALEQAGTAEGSAFLAESKRYGLAADCIEELIRTITGYA